MLQFCRREKTQCLTEGCVHGDGEEETNQRMISETESPGSEDRATMR